MKVVLAPDSFKDCLPADQAAEAMARGVRRADPDAEIVLAPMADGGQGTVAAMVRATAGRFVEAAVCGPLGQPVTARYGILGDGVTAAIEMAAAAGLELVPPAQRDPGPTTTFGVGELVRHALDHGVRRFVVGIGGSATNDGGAGLAQALGYRLLDDAGQELPRGGAALARLDRIDASGRDPRLQFVRMDVACDVTNPLTGPQGASAIYGPQKGADAAMVARLDAALTRLAEVAARDLGVDMASPAGAGAAGGLGGGLMAFCGATLRRGAALVREAIGLPKLLRGADLCLTGEGMLDRSSPFGKTAVGVAEAARAAGVPTILLAGGVMPEGRAVLDLGVAACFSLCPRPMPLEEALRDAAANMEWSAEMAVRAFLAGRRSADPPRRP